MSQSSKSPKPKYTQKPPIVFNAKYPTYFQSKWTKINNLIFNKLYPVPLQVFGASVALIGAYNFQFPSNQLMQIVPVVSNNIAKNVFISLFIAYLPVWTIRCFIKHVLYSYKGWLYEGRGKKSFTTKLWMACMGLLSKCRPRLNSCDNLLPSLPLPALSDTLDRYLDSMEPLLTEEQFKQLTEQARAFGTGLGRRLQRYLWFYSWTTGNYVSDWWKTYGYLYRRDPLLVNTSIAHTDLIRDEPATQACRAAHVVWLETLSMLAIENQSLKPLGGNGLFLTAAHYKWLYSVARIPDEIIDIQKKFPLAKHTVVYYRGCYYKVNLFDSANRLLSVDQFEMIFNDILCRKADPGPGEEKVAALTTTERHVWAQNRCRFFTSEVNKKALQTIESASFMIILTDDDYEYDPADASKLDSFLKSMLTGSGYDRWTDKSLNYVIGRNGRCGGTTEHSIGDGFEFDHIFENFVLNDVHGIGYAKPEQNGPLKRVDDTPNPAERLRFDLSLECQQEIDKSYERMKPILDDVDIAATVFLDYGKGLIKKSNVSPDAYIQMAIQLAYYMDQKAFALTYEAASARFYANGRTETLRTVTSESCVFVLAMLSSSSTTEERVERLRRASEKHTMRNREAMTGKGLDRHLFALFIVSKYLRVGHPLLDHFVNTPYTLSTSQAPTVVGLLDEDAHPEHSWLGPCFGPVDKDGYGVCYRFSGNHSLSLHVSSYHSSLKTDSHRFRRHLLDALKRMADLFDKSEQSNQIFSN